MKTIKRDNVIEWLRMGWWEPSRNDSKKPTTTLVLKIKSSNKLRLSKIHKEESTTDTS